jgi:Outer membrane cobalamin receptor protein
MAKNSLILLITLILLSGPGPALAQEAAVIELDTVVVTGRKIEEKLSAELAEYGHQVQVIQGETIEKMGFVDISEALNALVPGMYVRMKGRGDYSTYMMNGNSGAGILWLLDGVRLNNRLYGSAYMDTISVNLIDRIEILFGGEGLFYGTNSTSGVVNIITKKPSKERSGQFGVSYGTDELVMVNGYVSDSLAGNNLLVFGSYESWDGYRQFTNRIYETYGNNDRRNRGYDRTNIGLKYLREFGDEKTDRTLEFHLQRNTGDFDFGYPNYRSAVNARTENILTAKWNHDVTDNFSYYIKAYYHNWWTDYTRVRLDGSYQNNADEWGYQDWGINILNSYRFDRGDEVLLGFDYQNYWGRDDVLKIRPEHEEVYAVFTQYRPYFSFWPDWKMAFGLRYNHLKNNESTVWNISSRMPFFEDRLFLRANVGTSFILPTAEHLYADEPNEKGNPDLKPQSSFAANIGLGGNWEKGSLELSYFREEVKDRIGLDADDVFQNLSGKTKINGYTITGTLRPLESLALTASYTWQKAKREGKEEKRNNIPEDFGNVSLQWNDRLWDTPVGIGLFGRYIGSTPAYATTTDPQTYGKYWLADASIYANLTENSRISLYLSNIFDKKYPVTLGRATDSNGTFYYENPVGNPFSATLSYTYTF